uniref:SH2 domain-containing protein n=1 Tax=Mola mola TaxID=94237 RepID=A0A3Q3XI52_MOLML
MHYIPDSVEGARDEATERLLERFGQDGSFLLRDSETVPGAYCLCVRKAPFVHTYRLAQSTGGWCLLVSKRLTRTQWV